MHYLDEGKGETVLMVHGNPSWSFYFRQLVKNLRGTHRCIVPDHVGMGLFDRADEARYRYTLLSRIDDLETLMERGPGRPRDPRPPRLGGMIGTAGPCAIPSA